MHDFLKEVEENIMERGENQEDKERLVLLRNKILEKVKTRKMASSRSRERSTSASSLHSVSSKRGSDDLTSGEHKSRRTEFESSKPLLPNLQA